MDISKPKFEVGEIVEINLDTLKLLFLKGIESGEIHKLSLDYVLEYPMASVTKIKQNSNNQWLYWLYFLNAEVDDMIFAEKDLKPTGHFVKPNKFTSYEIVRIVNPSKMHKENLKYLNGFIDGMTINRNGVYYYGVFLFNKQEGYCFEEHELESTGQFVKKEDYYSGESVKVIVHPDGRGELKEE